MSQLSFASLSQKKKITSTEIFLNEMDWVIPWTEIMNVIKPHYYNSKIGRKPILPPVSLDTELG